MSDPAEGARDGFLRIGGRSLPWPFWRIPDAAADTSVGQLKMLRGGVREALTSIEGKRRELADARTGGKPIYTPEGIRAAVQEHVRSEVVPQLRRLRGYAAGHAAALAKEAEKLSPVRRLESHDAAGAVKRMELRTWLRGLPSEERSRRLVAQDADAELLDAVLDGPAGLSGIAPETHALISRKALERRHPEQVGALSDFAEAMQLVEGSFDLAEREVQRELRDATRLEPAADEPAEDEAEPERVPQGPGERFLRELNASSKPESETAA